MSTIPDLRQRADYTQKHNHKSGRHGWLRLTPAYSVKIVDELLRNNADRHWRVLDPFCGTGTTALCAASQGHEASTVEINPFLVWLASTKTATYQSSTIQNTRDACADVIELVNKEHDFPIISEPPIYNIERWWSIPARTFLCRLRPAIEKATKQDSQERNLLLVAFCRTLIALSNASFNHQSMSFRENATDIPTDLIGLFQDNLEHVLAGAQHSPTGAVHIIQGDARTLRQMGHFNLVITSPPYANRMSYIRELRPYMYWLGYLVNSRDAGELDWQAIGGTWGIATSRLLEWKPNSNIFAPTWLFRTLDSIAHADNANGILLANYIGKYSEDMWLHFESLTHILAPGAQINYIVGNSTFYGNMMPTERLYADMLAELGFIDIAATAIRKRNSKKELIEFNVSARWP